MPDYKSPDIYPYNSITDFKGVWIKFIAKKIKVVTAKTQTDGGLIIEDADPQTTWQFLLPTSVQENLVHEWQPWETMLSRLGGKAVDVTQMISDLGTLRKALTSSYRKNSVGAGLNVLSSQSRVNAKVDTPLVYEDTQRMEYTMTFNMVVKEDGGNGLMDIVVPVRDLQQHSSPSLNDIVLGASRISFPHIFEVKTESTEDEYYVRPLIDIKAAAITSIQPTYMQPYDKSGYPMRCELTVTFRNMEPIYSDTFKVFTDSGF